jgi:hypothetical protein
MPVEWMNLVPKTYELFDEARRLSLAGKGHNEIASILRSRMEPEFLAAYTLTLHGTGLQCSDEAQMANLLTHVFLGDTQGVRKEAAPYVGKLHEKLKNREMRKSLEAFESPRYVDKVVKEAEKKARALLPSGTCLDTSVYYSFGGRGDAVIAARNSVVINLAFHDDAKTPAKQLAHELHHVGLLGMDFPVGFPDQHWYELLMTLFMEGMATYVSEPMEGNSDYLKSWYSRNSKKRKRLFLDVDRLLSSVMKLQIEKGKQPTDEDKKEHRRKFVMGLGPVYFVGLEMVRELVDSKGEEYFRENIVRKGVVEFLREYNSISETPFKCEELMDIRFLKLDTKTLRIRDRPLVAMLSFDFREDELNDRKAGEKVLNFLGKLKRDKIYFRVTKPLPPCMLSAKSFNVPKNCRECVQLYSIDGGVVKLCTGNSIEPAVKRNAIYREFYELDIPLIETCSSCIYRKRNQCTISCSPCARVKSS